MQTLRLFSYLLLSGLLALIACQPDGKSSGTLPEPPDTSQVVPPNRPVPSEGITDDYTNTDRVIWQKPEVVIDQLGDVSNLTIADIGAGTGFFSLRLAAKARKVIAIDIEKQFIDYLDSIRVLELPEAIQSRLEPRLARPDDARLNPEEADIVLIVNTYMYIPNRIEYLKALKRGLKPGGRLFIIDFKKKRTPFGPAIELRVPLFTVEEEVEQAGFKWVRSNDTSLDYQYIVIAKK